MGIRQSFSSNTKFNTFSNSPIEINGRFLRVLHILLNENFQPSKFSCQTNETTKSNRKTIKKISNKNQMKFSKPFVHFSRLFSCIFCFRDIYSVFCDSYLNLNMQHCTVYYTTRYNTKRHKKKKERKRKSMREKRRQGKQN